MHQQHKRQQQQQYSNRTVTQIRQAQVQDRAYNYAVGDVDVPVIRSYEDQAKNYGGNGGGNGVGGNGVGGNGVGGGGYQQQYQQKKQLTSSNPSNQGYNNKYSKSNNNMNRQSMSEAVPIVAAAPKSRLLNYNEGDHLTAKRKRFKPPNNRAMIDVGVVIR